MYKSLLTSKRAEGYIETAVIIVVVAAVLAIALSIFSVIVKKTQMDRITEDLIETAAYEGEFGAAFDDRVAALRAQYGDFEVSYGPARGCSYFNETLERVQLGDDMYVTITIRTSLTGWDAIFPMELRTTRIGKSEQFWK